LNLWRQLVPRNGACLFHCLSEALYTMQQYWPQVRSKCLKQLREQSGNAAVIQPESLSLEQFINETSASTCCTTHPAFKCLLSVACSAFNCSITVYSINRSAAICSSSQLLIEKLQPPSGCPAVEIALACSGNGHYDLVLTLDRCASLAICQSVVFQLLMSDVFRISNAAEICMDRFDAAAAAGKNRRSRRRQLAWLLRQREQQEPEGGGQGRPALPQTARPVNSSESEPLPTSFRAVKAMSPSIYRNIQFDLWRSGDLPDLRKGALLLVDGCRIAYLRQVCADTSSCIVCLPNEPDGDTGTGRCAELPFCRLSSFGRPLMPIASANSASLTATAAATSTPSRPAVANLRLALGLKADVHWHDRSGLNHGSAHLQRQGHRPQELTEVDTGSNKLPNISKPKVCQVNKSINERPVLGCSAGPPQPQCTRALLFAPPPAPPIRRQFSLPSLIASLAMAPVPVPHPLLPRLPIQLDSGFSCCPRGSDLLCLTPITVVFFYNLGVQTLYCLRNFESFYTTMQPTMDSGSTLCREVAVANRLDENNNISDCGSRQVDSGSGIFHLLHRPPFVNLADPTIDYGAGFSLCQLASDLHCRSPSTLRFYYNTGVQAFRVLHLIEVFLRLTAGASPCPGAGCPPGRPWWFIPG
ncbi:hypothetical protein BOX15_Mlig000696g2, partial [Macrostomum lignano]